MTDATRLEIPPDCKRDFRLNKDKAIEYCYHNYDAGQWIRLYNMTSKHHRRRAAALAIEYWRIVFCECGCDVSRHAETQIEAWRKWGGFTQ